MSYPYNSVVENQYCPKCRQGIIYGRDVFKKGKIIGRFKSCSRRDGPVAIQQCDFTTEAELRIKD